MLTGGVQRRWLAVRAFGRVLGRRVCVSNRPGSVRARSRYALPTARSRRPAPVGVSARAHLAHPFSHSLSQLAERSVADRRQERVAVGEMAVGGIGDDPDHPRDLAKDDRVRPARSREFDARLDQRRAHGPTGPAPAVPRRFARLVDMTWFLSCADTEKSVVDAVHKGDRVDTVHFH